ncbi:MAG: 4-hydroxythreonine-4-phosphate dehydrogenase PdxA [Nitrospinota bacterium]
MNFNSLKIQSDKKIGITIGDPAGIGPEVVLKAYSNLPFWLKKKIRVFGNIQYLSQLADQLAIKFNFCPVNKSQQVEDSRDMIVDEIGCPTFSQSDFGKEDPRFAKVAIDAIDLAVERIKSKDIVAIVTAPVNKSSVATIDSTFKGQSEYLQRLSATKSIVMTFMTDQLMVALATTHHPLSDVSRLIRKEMLYQKIRLLDESIFKLLKFHPKIAVAALNPHASDNSVLGNEEADEIIPAILQAKSEGISIEGPYPADTLFTAKIRTKFDLILAMYHDQALIPMKALFFNKTINMTVGLPFLRVSVDHGTAFDIAGKNRADPAGMIFAIEQSYKLLSD